TLSRTHITNQEQLIRFHESLLFLRAFPQSAGIRARCESLLKTFVSRVNELTSSGVDMSAFDTFEASGIAGTVMQDTLSFEVARWLTSTLPRDTEIAWQEYEDERYLGRILPRFISLLGDDCDVEADTPWTRWIQKAKGGKRELPWLIRCFESLPVSEQET